MMMMIMMDRFTTDMFVEMQTGSNKPLGLVVNHFPGRDKV